MEAELLTLTAPSRTPSVKRITFEEYLDLLTEESKGDLIEGVLYMQSPPPDDHEKIFVFLIGILNAFVVRKKLGIVRGSRTAIKFSGNNGTQPDIVFISNSRRHLIHPFANHPRFLAERELAVCRGAAGYSRYRRDDIGR
jgi:Uma2 family endonuclease